MSGLPHKSQKGQIVASYKILYKYSIKNALTEPAITKCILCKNVESLNKTFNYTAKT